MKLLDGARIFASIQEKAEAQHDVLYCTSNVESALKQEMSRGISSTRNVDTVRIGGLDVVEMPATEKWSRYAIIAERGEVFPTVEDWKNGNDA